MSAFSVKGIEVTTGTQKVQVRAINIAISAIAPILSVVNIWPASNCAFSARSI